MKMLIDVPLSARVNLKPETTAEDLVAWEEHMTDLSAFMKSCCIWHKLESFTGGYILDISVQKCTLPEEKVNEFFYEVLTFFDGIQIEWAGIGGAGCDFAIRVVQIK